MSYLITGGAGYVGAHVVRALAQAGESVAVYDDLSTGDTTRLPDGVPLVRGSVLDRGLLDRTLTEHRVTTVVHLAGHQDAAESVRQPLRYYRENLHGLQILLEAVRGARVPRFVFGSSAAVYGAPETELITEDAPCLPTTPYGETKLAGEWLVRAAGRAHGINTAALRCVNVAGTAAPHLADTAGRGLLPMTFEYLHAGSPARILGDDYPTGDGTCVRDFVHVEDVADAFVAAAQALVEQPTPDHLTLNLSRGEGVSVRQLIRAVAEITGHTRLRPRTAPRRPGDPARIVACPDLAAKHLGWTASRSLEDMITSAWAGWLRTAP
ncbi:UDP-glucose 4-epimerase GalE [Streptomyces sp. NPDC127098]|uniref:UDP-glucose 4-epimerase GalE n=1 Tax=Streptomyces sp. NPDC127098 TaxID=3347137 RepID=UPI0036553749